MTTAVIVTLFGALGGLYVLLMTGLYLVLKAQGDIRSDVSEHHGCQRLLVRAVSKLNVRLNRHLKGTG